MNKLHDPELELFKRSVNLADYAKRAGYQVRPEDGAPGLAVLDHPNRDRIVVGQHPNGPWIYASVPDYTLRASGEPAEQALARLRGAIDRSREKGTIVEFVQQRDPLARRGEVALDQVRDCLRGFRATGLPLDFEGALRPPPYPGGGERALERDGERLPSGGSIGSNPELNRRRYDWAPPVEGGPRETEVERRLRQWREAQAAIEMRQRAAREVRSHTPPAPQPVPPPTAPGRSIADRTLTDRGAAIGSPGKSELGRRRYDWSPAPTSLDAETRQQRRRALSGDFAEQARSRAQHGVAELVAVEVVDAFEPVEVADQRRHGAEMRRTRQRFFETATIEQAGQRVGAGEMLELIPHHVERAQRGDAAQRDGRREYQRLQKVKTKANSIRRSPETLRERSPPKSQKVAAKDVGDVTCDREARLNSRSI